MDSIAPSIRTNWLPKFAGRLRHPILHSDGKVSIDRLVHTGEQELQASKRSFGEGHRNRGHMHAQSASDLLRRAIDRAAQQEAPLPPAVYAELAEAYALLGQAPDAATTDDPLYWEELARRALEEAQWSDARRALLHLHHLPEHAADALEMLEHVSAIDGQWQAALETSPQDPVLWRELGHRALLAKKTEAAMALWAAAAHAGEMTAVAEAAFGLLRTHSDRSVRQHAASLVLALGPSAQYCCAAALESLPLDLTLARRLYQRAEALADAAEDEGALADTSQAILQGLLRDGPYNEDAVGLMQALHTDDAALLFELGVAVGDAGLHEAAYLLLRRAANLAAPTAAGYTLLADAARAAGRGSEVPHWTSLRCQTNKPHF